MNHRQSVIAITATFLTALVVMVSGCGTTDAPSSSGGSGAGAPLAVTGTDGAQVTLPNGPAQRVVALEWEHAEILTGLGAGSTVVGTSDLKGYNDFVAPTVPLTGTPKNVGQRVEPSVESIAALSPDLVIASPRSIPADVQKQIKAIAPVLIVNTEDVADPIGALKKATEILAEAAGRRDRVQPMIRDFDDRLARAGAKIASRPGTAAPAVFTAILARGGDLQIRLHGKGTAAEAVLDRIGLRAAYTGPVDSSGLSHTDVEGLTTLPADTWFLYWLDSADDSDPVKVNLENNAAWKGLPYVTAGRDRGVAHGVWMYGGLQSMAAFADSVAKTLTAS